MSRLKKQSQDIQLERPEEIPDNYPVRLNVVVDFEVADKLMDLVHESGFKRNTFLNNIIKSEIEKHGDVKRRPDKIRDTWLNRIKKSL